MIEKEQEFVKELNELMMRYRVGMYGCQDLDGTIKIYLSQHPKQFEIKEDDVHDLYVKEI